MNSDLGIWRDYVTITKAGQTWLGFRLPHASPSRVVLKMVFDPFRRPRGRDPEDPQSRSRPPFEEEGSEGCSCRYPPNRECLYPEEGGHLRQREIECKDRYE